MLRRIVGALGRVLLTAGVLVLLFGVYQVWGTNIETRQAQQELDEEFDDLVRRREQAGGVVGPATDDTTADSTPDTTSPDTTSPDTTSPDSTAPDGTVPVQPAETLPAPAIGDLVGRISIPSIGLKNFKFVEGTGTEQLKRGAAHYPGTPLPGQRGNAAIAGHRTTYGAPFSNVDKIRVGDEIIVETIQGTFTYRAVGTTIVEPTDVSVLDQGDENLLTLTACHPRYDLRQRIIVKAELVGTPSTELPGQVQAPSQAESPEIADEQPVAVADQLDASDVDVPQLALWGAAATAVWLSAWAIARFVLARRGRLLRALPYVVGVLPFLVCLYFFYENLATALPASY